MRGGLRGYPVNGKVRQTLPSSVRFADSFSPEGEAFGAGYSVSPLTSPFHSR